MHSFLRYPLIRSFSWLLVLLLALTHGAGAQNDVCINAIGGLGGTPTFDGQVEGDVGWNNAVRVNVSGDLGSTTATKMQMGTVGSTLYLGLIVSAPTISPDTTVVVGFSPNDGVAAHDWRLHISPFDVAPPADGTSNNPPFAVTYWQNSSTWNASGGTVAAPGDWQFSGIKIFKLNSNHWEMEFQIPITMSAASTAGFCLTCGGGGTFKLYVNVMNAVGGTAPAVSQDAWPAGVLYPAGFITQNTPAPGTWGVGSTTVRPECTGVKLDWANIGVQDPMNASNIITDMKRFAAVTETTIAQCQALTDNANPGSNGPANIFEAKPTNTMPSTTANVSVSFRLANWGIPGTSNFSALGSPVPAGCNPLGGGSQCAGVTNNPTTESPINPTLTGDYHTTTWALNYKQSCFYKMQVHQCIHVDMDSNDPNTRFLNKSVERNMNFVPASTYQQKAFLNGNQGPLPAGHTTHRFLIALELDQDGPLAPGNTGGGGGGQGVPGRKAATVAGQPGVVVTGGGTTTHFNDPTLAPLGRKEFGNKVTNMFQWIARGYIYTGDMIVINGHSYENVKRAGDFGYIAGHNGKITGWTSKFEAGGTQTLTELTPTLYLMEVKPGEEGTVVTTITANEASGGPNLNKFAVFADLGAVIPNGTFSNVANTGVSFNAGLEYILNAHVSAEGILGVHHFPGKIAGDVTAIQFTAGGKVYLTNSPNRVFFRAGLGGYHFTSATTNFGGYFGGGLLHEFNAHFGLEGVYTFHAANTPGTATKFSTVQGGVRYAF